MKLFNAVLVEDGKDVKVDDALMFGRDIIKDDGTVADHGYLCAITRDEFQIPESFRDKYIAFVVGDEGSIRIYVDGFLFGKYCPMKYRSIA